VSIEAALTGHLVLSTLHTNDAVSSVTRLVDMGVEPFLLSSTMIGVIAQRLLRTTCKACAEPVEPHAELLETLTRRGFARESLTLTRGVGCNVCSKTGYKGRMGIYELLAVDEKIREMILKHASNAELTVQGREGGMLSLYEDGIAKVARGVTTYEELMRVTAE